MSLIVRSAAVAALAALTWCALAAPVPPERKPSPVEPIKVPLSIPGLIAFWDFQEEAGQARVARGPHSYRLREGGKAVERVADGVFGPYSAHFQPGGWLEIPRAECPALDIHGPRAAVSVVTWLKREPKPGRECEAVAGMWNESRRQRQYCLFLNLGIWESRDQVGAHVSSVGGPTPGYKYCMDAAIGATPIPMGAWHCAAISYDGTYARAYLDGVLDARGDRNPYRYEGGLFDGGPDGSDFTVGAVHRGGEMGNWFTGNLGGLAVYDRALTDEEMRALAACVGRKE